MRFGEYVEMRDLLGRESSGRVVAGPLGVRRDYIQPMPARLMRLDTGGTSASGMTYDPQSGEVEIVYGDGTRRRFVGVSYDDARRAGASSSVGGLISDLESGKVGRPA